MGEVDESAGRIVSAVEFCIMFPIHVVLLVAFYRRRHVHPIKGRQPKLVLYNAAIILFIGSVNEHLDLIWPFWPCGLYWWAVGSVCLLLTFMFLQRATILLFQMEITEDSLLAERMRRANQGKLWSPNWYTERRHWLNARWWLKWYGVILVIIAIEIGSTAHLSAFPQPCTSGSTDDFLMTYLPIIISGPFCVSNGVAMVGKRIRKHQADGYGLKVELTLLGLLSAFSCVLGTISVIVYGTGREMQVFAGWTLSQFCWALNFLQIGYPLYLSRQWARRDRIETLDQLSTLLDIPAAFQAFLQFSAKEFSTENVQFYQRVHLLLTGKHLGLAPTVPGSPKSKSKSGGSGNGNNNVVTTINVATASTPTRGARGVQVQPLSTNPLELLAEVEAIHTTFVEQNSVFEVNLSSTQRLLVMERLRLLRRRCGQHSEHSHDDSSAMLLATTPVAATAAAAAAAQATTRALGLRHPSHPGGSLPSPLHTGSGGTIVESPLLTHSGAVPRSSVMMDTPPHSLPASPALPPLITSSPVITGMPAAHGTVTTPIAAITNANGSSPHNNGGTGGNGTPPNNNVTTPKSPVPLSQHKHHHSSSSSTNHMLPSNGSNGSNANAAALTSPGSPQQGGLHVSRFARPSSIPAPLATAAAATTDPTAQPPLNLARLMVATPPPDNSYTLGGGATTTAGTGSGTSRAAWMPSPGGSLPVTMLSPTGVAVGIAPTTSNATASTAGGGGAPSTIGHTTLSIPTSGTGTWLGAPKESFQLLSPIGSGRGSHFRSLSHDGITIDIGPSRSVPAASVSTITDDELLYALRHIFDDAYQTILKLMQTNAFQRFHASPEYRQFVTEYRGSFPGTMRHLAVGNGTSGSGGRAARVNHHANADAPSMISGAGAAPSSGDGSIAPIVPMSQQAAYIFSRLHSVHDGSPQNKKSPTQLPTSPAALAVNILTTAPSSSLPPLSPIAATMSNSSSTTTSGIRTMAMTNGYNGETRVANITSSSTSTLMAPTGAGTNHHRPTTAGGGIPSSHIFPPSSASTSSTVPMNAPNASSTFVHNHNPNNPNNNNLANNAAAVPLSPISSSPAIASSAPPPTTLGHGKQRSIVVDDSLVHPNTHNSHNNHTPNHTNHGNHTNDHNNLDRGAAYRVMEASSSLQLADVSRSSIPQ